MQLQTNNPAALWREKSGIRSIRSSGAGGDTDVVVVPILYGQRILPGIVIYQGDIEWTASTLKLWQWGDSVAAYIISAWFALCSGKVELIRVIGNDKILVPYVAYNPETLFNDGTETIKPTVLIDRERVILVGDDLRTASTFDRENWTQRSVSGSVLNKYSVAFGNSLYVSVGESDGAKASCHTSPDGMVWTEKSNGIVKHLYSVTYQGGYFFAFGEDGVVYRSEDGDTWTAKTSGVVKDLRGSCSNGYRLICVGEDGTILTSDDQGTTWDARTSGTAEDLKAVCFGGGLFVAVGTGGAVLTSSDGTSWTVESSGITDDLNGVAYGLEKFVAVGVENLSNQPAVITSTDGSSWTDMSSYWGSGDLNFIVFDGVNFCTQQAGNLFFSQDFVTFTYITNPCLGYDFYGACYNAKAALFDYLSKLSGIAHIYFPGDEFDGVNYRIVCDQGGKLPSMGFEARRDLSASAVSYPQLWRTSSGENIKFLGNNPAAVIYDLLTNAQFNLGVSAANIDLASFNAVATLMGSAQSRADERVYAVNVVLDKQINAKTVIDNICQHCDLVLYEDGGKFYLKSMYDPDGTSQGVLHDDDCEDFRISRAGINDLSNVFVGTFLDADNNYAESTITVKNEALIAATGREVVRRVDISYFTDRTVACVRLSEVCQRESQAPANVSCTVARKWCHLRPGDLMTVINVEHDVSGSFRVISINLGAIDDLRVKLELEEAKEDLYDGNYVTPESSQGSVPQKTGVTTNQGSSSIQDAKADGSTKGVATFAAADFNDNGAGLISLDTTKPIFIPELASPPAAAAGVTKLYTPTGTFKINAVFSDGTEVTIYEWEP